MSKQRRRRRKRNKQIRSRRSLIRSGVEQLESRVLPGGFLDLLAGAAFASNFDLLPEDQLVPEEIESESVGFVLQTNFASSSLKRDLARPETSLDPNDTGAESKDLDDTIDIASDSHATAASLLAASFIDSFFASNQFADTSPSLPVSQSPPLSTPPRSYSSPISQLGAGVGTGSGQGYNVTGAEMPQSNVGNSFAPTSSMPAWMMGEGEDPPSGSSIPSGSSTASATSSASSPPPPPPATPPSTNMGDPCSGSASGSASGMASASGYVAIVGSSNSADESSGSIEFQIYFYGYAPCGFTVDYSTSPGSADADIDFTSTSGSISFGPVGALASQTVSVGIINDSIVEGDETFTLTLDSVHDGSGGAVKGKIDIGYGTGAGSGGASGSGSFSGGESTGVIRYDDYNLSYSATDGAEGGSPVALTLDVSPTPRHQISVGSGIFPPFLPGPALTGADFTDPSGNISINPGEAQKVHNLEVADDEIIERTEKGTIILSGASSTGDAVHILTPWTFTSVVDNEWRWVGEPKQISFDSNTVPIDAHWYPDASFLQGSMSVESVKNGGTPFEGPNGLRARVNGYFSDDALLGTQTHSGTSELNLEFICDKTYGTVSQAEGSDGAGSSDDDVTGELSLLLSSGSAEYISNPEETIVNVRFSGDAAVAGSLTTTVTAGGYGVGIEFSQDDTWGDHVGAYNSVGVLTCKKGSD